MARTGPRHRWHSSNWNCYTIKLLPTSSHSSTQTLSSPLETLARWAMTRGARILDTLGLISPQTMRYYPLDPGMYVINYAMPLQLILDQQPDWVVSPEVYIRNGLLKDARFQAQYQLVDTLPTDIYGSKGLMVFRRK